MEQGRALGESAGDFRLGLGIARRLQTSEIMQEHHHIRTGDGVPTALHADALHRVGAVAQACGIDDVQGHALDLDGLADLVSRRARNGRNDGQLGPRQCVEQGALAHIRLPCQHHLESFAQQCALPRLGLHLLQRLLQSLQTPLRLCLAQKVDVFLGKIERGLDQQAQLDQLGGQCAHRLRQLAGQRPGGAASSRLGAGLDQIGHALGLRQIEFAVEKRAPGELAGLRHPQA